MKFTLVNKFIILLLLIMVLPRFLSIHPYLDHTKVFANDIPKDTFNKPVSELKDNSVEYFATLHDVYFAYIRKKAHSRHTKDFVIVYHSLKNDTLKNIYNEEIPYLQYIEEVIWIPRGFIIRWRVSGHLFLYNMYLIKNNKVKKVLDCSCDFAEFAYYRGFDDMPHCLASEIGNRGKEEISRIFVFVWDKKKGKYVLYKTLSYYNKKLKYKDRFNLYKNNNPRFFPFMYSP